jgi:acyl carrier protein
MAQFQQMMTHFLDTQRSVMTAYLQGASGDAPTAWTAQSLSTGWPAPTAVSSPSAPATLLESLSAITVEEAAPQEAPAAPSREDAGLPDREQLTSRLLAIVSERTGYPVEMLNLDQDLEADLGIDSIKRVEILGNFQDSFTSSAEIDNGELMEQLAGVKTLGGIIACVLDRTAAAKPAQPESMRSEIPLEVLADAVLEQSGEELGPEDSEIQRYVLTTVETRSTGSLG